MHRLSTHDLPICHCQWIFIYTSLIVFICFSLVALALSLSSPQGYSRAMLEELNETASGSAERQLYVLMYRLLQHNEIDNKSVIMRIEEIMKGIQRQARQIHICVSEQSIFLLFTDLVDPKSVTAKAFRYFKPLKFEP